MTKDEIKKKSICVEVAYAELIDKITVLEIKVDRITDEICKYLFDLI